jgi:tyrosyl-tRNA synthetase
MHGRDAAGAAAETARKTFEEGAAAAGLPSFAIDQAQLEAGLGVLTAFVDAKLAASTSEARRHIKGGALRVNDVAISDPHHVLTPNDLANGAIKLSVGKKRHALLTAR